MHAGVQGEEKMYAKPTKSSILTQFNICLCSEIAFTVQFGKGRCERGARAGETENNNKIK